MSSYGYARVSTVDQDLTVQRDALEAAGCTIIREEKVSGTSTQGRDELRTLLDFVRSGDELVVTRVDRLARSIGASTGVAVENAKHHEQQRLAATAFQPREPTVSQTPQYRIFTRSASKVGSAQGRRAFLMASFCSFSI